MVTASRLEWLSAQLAAGRQCRVRMNSHLDRVIIHFVLLPLIDPCMLNYFALMMTHSMTAVLHEAIVVDHGHGTSSGEAHVSFSYKPRPLLRPAGPPLPVQPPDRPPDGPQPDRPPDGPTAGPPAARPRKQLGKRAPRQELLSEQPAGLPREPHSKKLRGHPPELPAVQAHDL
eukprot:10294097-Heterocapsa_arctica.AAC.1